MLHVEMEETQVRGFGLPGDAGPRNLATEGCFQDGGFVQPFRFVDQVFLQRLQHQQELFRGGALAENFHEVFALSQKVPNAISREGVTGSGASHAVMQQGETPQEGFEAVAKVRGQGHAVLQFNKGNCEKSLAVLLVFLRIRLCPGFHRPQENK